MLMCVGYFTASSVTHLTRNLSGFSCQIHQISETSRAQIFNFVHICFCRKTDIIQEESQNTKCHECLMTD